MEEFKDFYPHLENCTQVIESQNGVALCVLIDTKKHQYLGDHVFGGMCFVPATMIMELLMEAALWYTRQILKKTEYFPVRLKGINIERALAISKGESMKAMIDFQSVTEVDGQVTISLKIHSERKSAAGGRVGTRVNTTGQVVLSADYPAEPSIEIPNCLKDKYSIPKDIYYNYYFPSLGYSFNSCTGSIAFDKEQRVFLGTYNCSGKEEQFIKDNNSTFLSSPLGNDSCLQYAVYFSRVLALTGRLPIGGKEFIIFKKHPLEGEVKVFIKCLHIDDEIMIFDFYSFDDTSFIAAGKEFKIKKSPYHKEFSRQEFCHIMDKYKEDMK